MPIINHIGLSGGKDSTALWGWAFNDSGYDPATIRGTFADTENEYDEVYRQIDALDEYGQKHGAPPVRRLKSIGFLQLAIKKKRFPGARARFCTEQLKIVPVRKYFEELWLDGFDVITHSGVRRDESVERSMMDEWDYSEFIKSRVRRPLLDWTIQDVWDAHRRYGLPINPLYLQGWKRVGCMLCCMSNKEDVRRTVLKRPWVIDRYREWERIVSENNPNGGIASFFPADTVPEAQRSKTYTNRKGETYSVATIDDVARWSMTLRGGVQGGFDFMFDADDAHMPCASGYCE